jgi:hypothetical protein
MRHFGAPPQPEPQPQTALTVDDAAGLSAVGLLLGSSGLLGGVGTNLALSSYQWVAGRDVKPSTAETLVLVGTGLFALGAPGALVGAVYADLKGRV